MSAQHPTAWPPYPAARRNPRDRRDRTAWIAPTAATVLLTILVPAAGFLGLLSVMATDSCGTDCSRALTTSLTLIYGTLFFGAFLTHGAWVTAWALPWTRRWTALRIWMAALSLLPPVFVLVLVFTLPGA
ncbi:hypothetical protein NGM36_33435 [Streptomyces mutabilis]|uniref:hypothetical protein n=1 Tax=Streptomyces mutabilis TaxID=67332 RepID=UPI0022BA681F|nr:hypothetical protein [Streptomyces mutabilis]MCZ9354617.1 hypothetical protein [Streptomyces mutabilis]